MWHDDGHDDDEDLYPMVHHFSQYVIDVQAHSYLSKCTKALFFIRSVGFDLISPFCVGSNVAVVQVASQILVGWLVFKNKRIP